MRGSAKPGVDQGHDEAGRKEFAFPKRVRDGDNAGLEVEYRSRCNVQRIHATITSMACLNI
jgi:hypothetical protein